MFWGGPLIDVSQRISDGPDQLDMPTADSSALTATFLSGRLYGPEIASAARTAPRGRSPPTVG